MDSDKLSLVKCSEHTEALRHMYLTGMKEKCFDSIAHSHGSTLGSASMIPSCRHLAWHLQTAPSHTPNLQKVAATSYHHTPSQKWALSAKPNNSGLLYDENTISFCTTPLRTYTQKASSSRRTSISPNHKNNKWSGQKVWKAHTTSLPTSMNLSCRGISLL